MYENLPGGLGLRSRPLVVAAAGAGGGRAAGGRRDRAAARHAAVTSPTRGSRRGARRRQPIELPGILLAALATLGLGLVLGPEAPLIALGGGLAVLAVRRVKKDTPDQVMAVLAAARRSPRSPPIFGSPVIGAIILIEAAGLGGPMLPLVLLPGLMSAGIGSVIFIGMGQLDRAQLQRLRAEPVLRCPRSRNLTVADFGWAIALAVAAAVVTFAIIELARVVGPCRRASSRGCCYRRRRLAVGGLAIAFAQITDQSADAVLFSGQDAFGSADQAGPHPVPVHPGVPAPVQGRGLEHLAGQLPRRPDIPGACSSARPGACSPRTCPGSPRRRRWPC